MVFLVLFLPEVREFIFRGNSARWRTRGALTHGPDPPSVVGAPLSEWDSNFPQISPMRSKRIRLERNWPFFSPWQAFTEVNAPLTSLSTSPWAVGWWEIGGWGGCV